MTQLESVHGHLGDSFNPGARWPFGVCLNCGQQLLIVSSEGHDDLIGAGVVAFTSFVKNEKTQVFVRNALKEIYSVLHPIELAGNELENCALCVDCSLVFAQLFGLFQTFESRRKSQGLLDVVLTKGLQRVSDLTRNTNVNENEENAQEDFSSELETFAHGFGADECDSMGAEIEVRPEKVATPESIPSPEHRTEDRHPTTDYDDVILVSDSDNTCHEFTGGSPECEILEEASDGESGEAASRSTVIFETNSVQAPRDAKTNAIRSEYFVTRPRRTGQMEYGGQSAARINVTEANVSVEKLADSDYVPMSCDSETDDDGRPKIQQNVIYKCADCPEELPYPSILAKHRKHIHGSSELFKCHICFSNLRNGGSLTIHLRRHGDIKLSGPATKTYTEAENIYKCIDCDEKFPIVSQLRHHRVDIHGADETEQHVLVCHICCYSTNRPESFKRHFLLHVNKTGVHKCSECGKSFNLFRKLQIHMKTQHRIMLLRNHNHPLDPLCDKIILRCRKCEAEFDCEERLLEHSKDEHGDGSFRCDICKSVFFQESTLQRHMSEHGKPKMKCRFCDKKYKTRHGRRLHENNAHLVSSTQSKQICSKATK